MEWGGWPQDVTIRARGEASVADAGAFISEILSDPRYRPGLKILIDHSGLQSVGYSPAELHELIDRVRSLEPMIQESYCAVVVPRPALFGMMRIWEAELFQAVAKARLRLFHSADEAVAWLSDPGGGDEGAAGAG